MQGVRTMSDVVTQIFTATIAAPVYVDHYRDADRVATLCRACTQYGRSWGCPPFEYDVLSRLQAYNQVLIVAMKVTPAMSGLTWKEVDTLLRPHRKAFDARLLALERQHGGLACHAGSCISCADGECARLCNKPCRHEQHMRPSLEAYGFDVEKTMSQIFNLPLQWSAHNQCPEYIVYVGALFHNAHDVEW